MAKRLDIPVNTCMFILEGDVYVPDGCNCSEGYGPPPTPPVPDEPPSPVYVACVPVDGGGQSVKKS
jgi:hypothetical protein